MCARILCLLLVPALVFASAVAPRSAVLADDLDDLLQKGVITAVSPDSISIANPQTENAQTFVVNAATKITRNNKPALLRDLQTGELARITARKINERRMAASIVVTTR